MWRASARISRSWRGPFTVSRWFIWTTPPPRKSRAPCWTPSNRAYGEEYANVHRGLHFLSNAATDNYEKARTTVARFLNAAREEEIIFTKNATEAINLVAQSFGGMRIGEGDEIVLSIMEHHSNIVPWHFHRERRGRRAQMGAAARGWRFDLEAFERALQPRTKMVADHAYVERARHGGAGERGVPHRP